MTNSKENHVKVHYPLDVDENGWPPVGVESLWAEDLGDGTVRVANAPWFAQGVASGDVVRVEVDDDGVRWAEETVDASDHCTIRLIVLQDGGSAGARQSVLDEFQRLGATGEGVERFGMVALDVPPSADLPGIRALLERGDAEGRWDWEEGCVTAAWAAHDGAADDD
ncbi:DUF4265 domain-containing protein [Kitasatospora sp. NPDC057904]|uniref:DUF4265 domain-containing protein n=1 Tax=Kitasatospora sp. NPDC057904 TaxID=3346275 RepID=UPI0036DB0852